MHAPRSPAARFTHARSPACPPLKPKPSKNMCLFTHSFGSFATIESDSTARTSPHKLQIFIIILFLAITQNGIQLADGFKHKSMQPGQPHAQGRTPAMFQSLHSVLTPLRARQATGTLSLEHRNGQKVLFSLYKGEVVSCLDGRRHGVDAARIAATWLAFDSNFYEGIVSENDGTGPIDGKYFDMLVNIDQRIKQYSRIIPHDDMRYRLKKPSFEGEIEFKGYELKVALLLDGKRTVNQVTAESGISDFLVLSSITKFSDLGMIEMV
jgi:hypothetical protein